MMFMAKGDGLWLYYTDLSLVGGTRHSQPDARQASQNKERAKDTDTCKGIGARMKEL